MLDVEEAGLAAPVAGAKPPSVMVIVVKPLLTTCTGGAATVIVIVVKALLRTSRNCGIGTAIEVPTQY